MAIKTILLTGGTGFVGSHLAVRLLDLGYDLRMLARGSSISPRERVRNVLSRLVSGELIHTMEKNISVIEGDITHPLLGLDRQIYKRLSVEVDEVWHCAASVRFEEESRKDLEIRNISGTTNVLAFVRSSHSGSLQYISTAYVAGRRNGLIRESELVGGCGFKNPYEETKFRAEELVRDNERKFGIRTAVYRPAVIVGNSRTWETSSFTGLYGAARILDLISRKAGSRRSGRPMGFRLEGIGDANVNLVPIDYVADSIIAVYRTGNSAGKTFHIVNPDPIRNREMWDGIGKAVGVKVDVVSGDEFRKRPMTAYEKLFAKQMRPYAPYLFDKFIFDDTNTRECLLQSGVGCPLLTGEHIYNLIRYCYRTNWGKDYSGCRKRDVA